MGQRLFLGQVRLGLLPSSTDATTYWQKRAGILDKRHNRLRLICETVNAQLQEQLHLSKHYAKSTWGLLTRMAAKVTAHSVGMMVNTLLGRPALKLADLAV